MLYYFFFFTRGRFCNFVDLLSGVLVLATGGRRGEGVRIFNNRRSVARFMQ
jgi:hypothetical protein